MTDLPIPGRGLHIIHHNARSIKHDTDLFKFYIRHSEVGLYTVSETWLHDDTPDTLMHVNGYTLLRVDRNRLNHNGDRMEGGGVAIYIKDGITFTQAGLSQFNISNKDIEMLWVRIVLPVQLDMILGVVYRPPSGSTTEFSNIMLDVLKNVREHDPISDLTFLGDININYLDKDDDKYSALEDIEQEFGVTQYITSPTRKNAILDLAYSDCRFI